MSTRRSARDQHCDGTLRKHRLWIGAISAALLVSATVAGIATYLDWRLNPDGIFQGADGTDWAIVWDTWISWCAPVLLLAAIVLALAWYARRARTP